MKETYRSDQETVGKSWVDWGLTALTRRLG